MSLVEFEKHKVVKSFMSTLDVYHTNLGGYHYRKDDSPCYYLNGMLTMFEEQQKNIDLLEKEITETQAFFNKQNRIKQTKIDELNERSSEEKRILHNVIEMNQAKIDELQARIDEALGKCRTGIRKQGGDYYLELVEDILKGNKDEK